MKYDGHPNYKELRCYTFTLYQLSSIQQGIQAGHAAVELVSNYIDQPMVASWAKNHKTLICLNVGDVSDMKSFITFLEQPDNDLPWIRFNESEESLASITTSVAMVLPYAIWKYAEVLRKKTQHPILYDAEPTLWESYLIEKISTMPLAR